MFEFFQTLGSWGVTGFVIASMLNVGLTQRASRVIAHLSNGAFLVRMLVLNFLVVPALMVAATDIIRLEPVYEAGLIILGVAAGAPFLIRLAALSDSDIALGTTVLLVLMVGTVIVLPVLLPLLLEGVSVDVWAVVQGLVLQLIVPLLIGMALLQYVDRVAAAVQPWVARFSSISLYVLIIATLIGFLPTMADPGLWKALAVGMAVLVLALFLGWAMGDGHDHLQDLGGLGTAQRGTAAALIVAQSNFEDPRVTVLIVLVTVFGIVMLVAAAKLMSRSNAFDILIPEAADRSDTFPRTDRAEADRDREP